jgi:Skp family chaperone for outer membrane proteins
MKFTVSVFAALFLAVFAIETRSQTTAPPVAQTPAVPIKLAVIDSGSFGDPKTGIKRLITASNEIETALSPKRQELTNKNNRLQVLAQKSNMGTLTAQEADEADTLKRDIQRGQEDGQKSLDLLTRQKIAPILNDLGNALQAYAKQRGFDIVVDISKFDGSILLINQGLDITDAFILDFNGRNPGTTAAPATPAKTP